MNDQLARIACGAQGSQNPLAELGDDNGEWEEVLREGIKTPKEYSEFLTYCDFFYTYAKKAPCHIRRGYEQGFIARTASYKNGSGSYYPACFPGLLDKHLGPTSTRATSPS